MKSQPRAIRLASLGFRLSSCSVLAVALLARGQTSAPATAPAPLILFQGMTKTQLDRVAFAGTADAAGKPTQISPLVFPDLLVGLHVNPGVYAQGDAVTAYFVLKNLQGLTRSVELRPEYFRDLSRLPKTIKVDLRRTDGKDFDSKGHATTPPINEELEFSIPPRSLVCFSADLRTLATDNALPAGQYAVTWTYAGIKSKEAAFTVGAAQAAGPATAPASHPGANPLAAPAADPAAVATIPTRFEFLDLMGSTSKRTRGQATLDWTNSNPNHMSGTQIGCGLAAGIDGRFYPDMFNLPTRDESFELSAEFVPGQKNPADNDDPDPRKDTTLDHIDVKITPIGAADATLPRMLMGNNDNMLIGLQIESTTAISRKQPNFEGDPEGTQDIPSESWNLDKGGTIHITLRKDWKNALTFSAAKVRLAVVILSQRPEIAFESDGQEIPTQPPKLTKYWHGALRTNYVMVDVRH